MTGGLHEAVTRFLRERGLKPEQALLAAVSGGADSLTLLHVLAELRETLGFRLEAAHLHHGMREDADDDVERLQAVCVGLGVPLHAGRADVPAIAACEKASLEVAGRLARYRFLYETAAAVSAHAVCTGHTKDDQAETLLLRIVAGTGIEGLGGIAPARLAELPESTAPVWLWRPLLEVTRAETAAFCAERGSSVVDDPANADMRYPRNRVRHVLLPLLERDFNPAIRDALARLADLAREDEAILQMLAEGRCPVTEADGAWGLKAEDLLALPLALQRRTARGILKAAGGTGKALGFENVERFLNAVRAAQRECHLHGAFALRCRGGEVSLQSIQHSASSIQESTPDLDAGC